MSEFDSGVELSWRSTPNFDDQYGLDANGQMFYFEGGNVSRSGSQSQQKPSVSVACVACRSRHLKCDGGSPCSRCKADSTECNYVKSRRGWRPRKRKAVEAPHPDENNQVSASPEPHEVSTSSASRATSDQGQSSELLSDSIPSVDVGLASNWQYQFPTTGASLPGLPAHVSPRSQYMVPSGDSNRFIEAFLNNVWPAHPFLLPKDLLMKQLQSGQYPYLQAAIDYIGSFHIAGSDAAHYREKVRQSLADKSVYKKGQLVQALLLFAIGLQAEDRAKDGIKVLHSAIDMALELRMNTADFAIQNSKGYKVVEECWRRTWWELFVVEGMFSGVNQIPSTRLYTVPSDMPLPCEDCEYQTNNIPPSVTFQSYDDSAFLMDDDYTFSSYAYRIDSIRILHSLLPLGMPENATPEALTAAETKLTNWKIHLPPSKRTVILENGALDHLLFQAHMINNAATVILHQPRSTLDPAPPTQAGITTCMPKSNHLMPAPPQSRDFHTQTTLNAANNMASLIRLPVNLRQFSPFFTCVAVKAAVVHLCHWTQIMQTNPGADSQVKEFIKLEIGMLKTLSELWPLAKTTLGQVRSVAGEMFRSQRVAQQQPQPQVWNVQIDEGVLRDLELSMRQHNGVIEYVHEAPPAVSYAQDMPRHDSYPSITSVSHSNSFSHDIPQHPVSYAQEMHPPISYAADVQQPVTYAHEVQQPPTYARDLSWTPPNGYPHGPGPY